MNKVILMGRLVKDVELKYTGNNIAISTFTLAVNRRYAKQGEQRQADFINCKAFNKTAEFINNYFKKGSMLGIVGRLEIRTWDDQEGKRHYFTEIMVDEPYFTGEKKEEGQQQQSKPQAQNQDEFYPVSDEDDELPF